MVLDGNIRGQRVHPTLGNKAKGQRTTFQGHNYPHSGKTHWAASARDFLFFTAQSGLPSKTQVLPNAGVNDVDSAELCSDFEL